MENEKNEKMDRERIELVVHDRGGRPPFEAPNEVYILTFSPQPGQPCQSGRRGCRSSGTCKSGLRHRVA